MDFTYIVAGFIAFLVGAVGGSLFLLMRGNSFRRLLAVTVPVTIVIDFALLLDWSRVDLITTAFLLTDFGFFTLYSLIGCSLGALPFLAARSVYRRVTEGNGD